MIKPDLLESVLLRGVPSGSFSISHQDSKNGPWTTIEPANVRAARLSVCLNNYGNCDILFGKAFAMELELSESDLLLSLGKAAMQGHFMEFIWSVGSAKVYSKSVIQLDDRPATVRSGVPLPYPWWWKHTYRYEPF